MVKRIILGALFIVLFLVATSRADHFNFEWDYPADTTVDGFRMYSGPMGTLPDGTWYPDLSVLVDNIPPDARTTGADVAGWPDASKKWCFVARAFRGATESPDSNMVCQVIDNTPLTAPGAPMATWDPDNSTVIVSWTQADLRRVNYWRLYYACNGGDTQELGRLDYTGQQNMILSEKMDEHGVCTFRLVAFKNDDVYSPDSPTATIDIIKPEGVPAPSDLRFSLTIVVDDG